MDSVAKGRTDRILIVDDDIAGRLLAREALEQSGFTVDEAENGRDAVERVGANFPDIILLDVMMPEMDGFAACAAIRALPEGQHVPVLMMTGLDDVDSINRAYAVGATDFTTKPINYLLLSHRIRYMLRAKRTADKLRASEARLADAQRVAKLGHFDWDLRTHRIVCSAYVNEIFGLPASEAIDSKDALLAYIHPEDRKAFLKMVRAAVRNRVEYRIEHRIIRADGAVRAVYQQGELLRAANARGRKLSATIQDVTRRRLMQQRVRRLAYYDTVTDLPNRTHMQRYLSEAIAEARANNRIVAVMVLNIDHFSRINETLGHTAGDDLLKTVANRLLECVREGTSAVPGVGKAQPTGALVARIGGDEFVIVLTEIQALEDVASVARRICNGLTASCVVGDTEVTVSASIGISGFPVDSLDSETLLKQADVAMHHAKSSGRNRYEFSTASINSRVFERFALESNLRKALATTQFELHYQPKMCLAGQVPVGMEALVRWNHPDMGMVPPSVFIPVAEETGLIVPMGEWILHEACRQVKAWQTEGLPPLIVSVNLSAAQFRAKGFHAVIGGAIKDTDVDPTLLELELTESLLMEDRDLSIRMMQKLRWLGVSLSIDDFGTGYSSLSYLKRFPITALKIDRSFVFDVGSDADDAAIVTAIIALAHSLRLKVVAEGVENETQLKFLSDLQCDEVQGYYFSRPLTAVDFSAWVRRHANAQPSLKLVSS